MQRLTTTLGLDRATAWHGLRLALAAWLALAVALALRLPNPYWAAMPVWVVTQASAGLLLERAVFRVLGTLIGAAAGFAVLRLSADPWLVFLLLGLWVGMAGALTHLLRGVHAYGALVAGMTAAVVVLPVLFTPGLGMALAWARVECTLIGVLAVTAVTARFTPGSARAAFYRRARDLAADALDCAAVPEPGGERERAALAGIAALDESAALISAGSVEGYRRLRGVHALVVAALATLAAGRALRGRRTRAEPLPDNIAAWAASAAQRLRADAACPPPPAAWAAPAAPPALRRLHEAAARLLAAAAALGASPAAADATSFGRKLVWLAPGRDWRQAARAGLVTGGATALAAALGLLSGWSAGELAALGVCIFSTVVSAQPEPRLAALRLCAGTLAGVAMGVLYRLAAQPPASAGIAILASVVPVLVLGGQARAARRTAIPAIDFNMGFLLAGQVGMAPAGVGPVLSGAASLAIAALAVAGGFVLMPRPPLRRAAAVAAALRRDLARMIARPAGTDPWRRRASGAILRLTLDLGRAGTLAAPHAPGDILAVLSLGHAIEDLHAAADPAAVAALTRLRGFAADPAATARALMTLAEAVAPGPVREAITDAAGALEAGAPLLCFGQPAASDLPAPE